MSHGLALDHAAWSSPWRARSVRDKAVLSFGLLISAVALPPFPGGATVALASLTILVVLVKVGWRRLARILWLPLVSILIGVITVAVSVSWNDGLVLQFTDVGLSTAGALMVRALSATLSMFILACSTPMVDLFAGLRRVRIPDVLIEIASLIYRLTFGLLETAGTIRAAQEARLGYATRGAAMRSASMATTVLFVRSWDRASRLEDGLAGRGYDESLCTLDPERVRSTRFVASSLAIIAAIVAVSVLWEVAR